jgi:uridylate kinase
VPTAYKRILLKVSGEALASGEPDDVIDFGMTERIAGELATLMEAEPDMEIAIVVGGGNIWRGAPAIGRGMRVIDADHMGMLATIINALALKDALLRINLTPRVMSALPIDKVCEPWIPERALRHMEKRRIVICAAGLGDPNFTTDTASVQRAIQLEANVLLKGTHGSVQGVYTADPRIEPDARLLDRITYRDAIERGLSVMDGTAFTHAEDGKLPTIVFNLMKEGNILLAATGHPIGTLVTP